jgi:hypothetical protein
MSGLYTIPTDIRSGDGNEHAVIGNMHMNMGGSNAHNHSVTEHTSMSVSGNMK